MSSLCKSCRAAVVWVTTEDGNAMPVDAAPVRGGNLRLDGTTAVYVQPLLETDEQKAKRSSPTELEAVSLAREYGVTPTAMCSALRRRTWRHL